MVFFKGFSRKSPKGKYEKSAEPILVATISNMVSSEIFQDILKTNNIPFVCRQRGACGYIKILTGGLLSADCIYVNERDYESARELYKTYIESDSHIQISNSEDI